MPARVPADEAAPSASSDALPAPSPCCDPMEQPSSSPCFDPKQQLSCDLGPEDPLVEGTERAAASPVQIQETSVASPVPIQEPSDAVSFPTPLVELLPSSPTSVLSQLAAPPAPPLEKIRDPPLQLQSVLQFSSLPASAVGPQPSSLPQDTSMAPEMFEQSLKVLQEQLESLKVEITDLKHTNKRLEDQLAAAEHIPNLKADVQLGEQEKDLISKLIRCHDYICCEKEQAPTRLPDFVSDEVFVDLVQAPGSELLREKLTPLAKLVSMGMIDDIYRLHLEGLSLNGEFSSEDFYWTSNKKVKLGRRVLERAKLKSDVNVNKDYIALNESIDNVFKSAIKKGELPADFNALLKLMKSPDPSNKKGLIRYNMSLMDEIGKKTHFLTMHARFEQLLKKEKYMPNKAAIPNSEVVLSYIVAGEEDWPRTLQNNRFVLKAHTRHVLDKGLTREPNCGTIKSRKELLEKWRHSLTHLHEHAIELGEAQFHDADHVQMLESCTELVFTQFQEGMHAIGELEYPHLVASLKA